jgi:recombination protein RecA
MIIGIDSVGALDTYKLVKGATEGDVKADQGQLQKQIRRMLRLLLNICVEQNSIGIVTGHMYGQPGVVPMPDQIGGGKAMRMFPSIIIQLRKDTVKKDRPVQNEIIATTIKNRMYPPFQEALVKIDYREGINPYAGLINILSESKIVEKSGATFSFHENM